MPRFFFDVHNGTDQIDKEGLDLPDSDAARRVALRLMTDLAGSMLDQSASPVNLAVRIHTEDGLTVCTAKLRIVDRSVGTAELSGLAEE